jgi:poly(3-hydroxybutyrate) depolymerase
MLSKVGSVMLMAKATAASNSTASTIINLGELNVKPGSVTVSGLSSGGYMAVQMHVAYSALYSGVGVFAGGPYYCALGSLAIAEEECMYGMMGGPKTDTLVSYTKEQAAKGTIDPTDGLTDAKVFVFSGSKDTTVYPAVVKTLEDYYGAFGNNKLNTEYTIPAQHCMPTTNTVYGEACDKKMSPYIGKCAYDGAEAALETLYGDLSTGTRQREIDKTKLDY